MAPTARTRTKVKAKLSTPNPYLGKGPLAKLPTELFLEIFETLSSSDINNLLSVPVLSARFNHFFVVVTNASSTSTHFGNIAKHISFAHATKLATIKYPMIVRIILEIVEAPLTEAYAPRAWKYIRRFGPKTYTSFYADHTQYPWRHFLKIGTTPSFDITTELAYNRNISSFPPGRKQFSVLETLEYRGGADHDSIVSIKKGLGLWEVPILHTLRINGFGDFLEDMPARFTPFGTPKLTTLELSNGPRYVHDPNSPVGMLNIMPGSNIFSFKSASLVTLKLQHCKFAKYHKLDLPCLTSMEIIQSSIRYSDVQRLSTIFRGIEFQEFHTPMLKDLKIIIDGEISIRFTNIYGPSLENLVVKTKGDVEGLVIGESNVFFPSLENATIHQGIYKDPDPVLCSHAQNFSVGCVSLRSLEHIIHWDSLTYIKTLEGLKLIVESSYPCDREISLSYLNQLVVNDTKTNLLLPSFNTVLCTLHNLIDLELLGLDGCSHKIHTVLEKIPSKALQEIKLELPRSGLILQSYTHLSLERLYLDVPYLGENQCVSLQGCHFPMLKTFSLIKRSWSGDKFNSLSNGHQADLSMKAESLLSVTIEGMSIYVLELKELKSLKELNVTSCCVREIILSADSKLESLTLGYNGDTLQSIVPGKLSSLSTLNHPETESNIFRLLETPLITNPHLPHQSLPAISRLSIDGRKPKEQKNHTAGRQRRKKAKEKQLVIWRTALNRE